MECKLNHEEVSILVEVLNNLTIRNRTGELGIIHGADRFVSTNVVFKKHNLEILEQLAQKLGISSGIKKIER